jgi:hypothetical protein
MTSDEEVLEIHANKQSNVELEREWERNNDCSECSRPTDFRGGFASSQIFG